MAEQTNFYAVQRGAPWSFRPVSDGVINWYLYNFGSNLGVTFVERPSNLWVEMPWNCIFRVKNIVFSSASGGRRPPDPPLWAPYIFTSGFFFFPCALYFIVIIVLKVYEIYLLWVPMIFKIKRNILIYFFYLPGILRGCFNSWIQLPCYHSCISRLCNYSS